MQPYARRGTVSKPREGFRGQDCGFGTICPSAHSNCSFNQGFLSPFDPLKVAGCEADCVWWCFGVVFLFVFAFDVKVGHERVEIM